MIEIKIGQRWRYNGFVIKDVVEVVAKGTHGDWTCRRVQIINVISPKIFIGQVAEYSIDQRDPRWEYLKGQDIQ